jgi:hypothetical protein
MDEQTRDFGPFAHDKTAVAPLDQRRAAKQQAIVGASEPKIVGRVLAQTPNWINHDRPRRGDV